MSEALHGNPEAQRRDQRLREHLRNEGYEVIAIPVSDLTDRGAMAGYLGRLARLLIGKEAATRLKEDTSWFDLVSASAGGGVAAEGDEWESLLELVEEQWRPLLEGLRAQGVPAPDDADWDVPIGGRVSGEKAVVVWRPGARFVALVGKALEGAAGEWREVAPESEPGEVAAWVRLKLGGEP